MQKPGKEKTVDRAADAIRRMVQVLRESAAAIERGRGISGAQLFVLRSLANGEATSLNDLADRVHTHQSSVSVVVSKLVERALVERRRSASDGRQIELAITAVGRQLLRGAPLAAQERLIAGLRGMAPARCRQLARSLTELVTAMGAEVGAPPMLFAERDRRAKSRSRR